MTKPSRLLKTATKGQHKPLHLPPITVSAKGFLANPLLHLLILTLVALAAYSNTFAAPFVFDDQSSIVDNRIIKDLSAFLSGKEYAYNPRRFIANLSLALNYKFGGLDTTGYHVVNLTIHIMTAWLVYAMVSLTLRTPFFKNRGSGTGNLESGTGDRGPGIGKSLYSPFTLHTSPLLPFLPLLAALLFVAHPIQTQAVTYIVQRLASLATLFYLLSLTCYIKGRMAFDLSSRNLGSERNLLFTVHRSPFTFFILSLIAAILAMRTKEIAATLPLIVILYEFSFFGSGRKKKLLLLAPFILLLLIIPLGIIASGRPAGDLLSDINQQMRVETAMGRGTYLLTQFSVIATYIRLLFLPIAQNLDYDYPIYDSLFELPVLGGFILICSLVGIAAYLYYRTRPGSGIWDLGPATGKAFSDPRSPIPDTRFYRLSAFGILWFFITLSVESSVIPIADVIFEHRLYLPGIGAFIAISSGVLLLQQKVSLRLLTTAMLCITVLLAGSTWARNAAWQDAISLWTDTVEKSPRKARPHYNLGKMLMLENRLDEAFSETTIAVQLGPDSPEAHNNLAVVCEKKGIMDQALIHYRKAVDLAPQFVTAIINLGAACEAKGLYSEAEKQYQEAIRLGPDNFGAHNNLGGLYIKTRRVNEAIGELKTALGIDPARAEALGNLGVCYEKTGHLDEAIMYYQKALQIKPDDFSAHLNLGNVFLGKGGTAQAIGYYREAIRLQPKKSLGYVNLGIAFLKTGEIDKAIDQFAAAQQAVPGDPLSKELLAKALPYRKMVPGMK